MHSSLFVLMTSLTNSYIYYLYSIDKSNGSILRTKKLSTITNLDAAQLSSGGYFSLLLAPRAADIYFGIGTTSQASMGFLRLSGFDSSTSIDWYKKLSCSSCYPTALAESSHSTSYLYLASVEGSEMKVRHFDDSGQEYWTASITSSYRAKSMHADGTKVIVVSEYGSTQDLLVTILGGLSSGSHTNAPST